MHHIPAPQAECHLFLLYWQKRLPISKKLKDSQENNLDGQICFLCVLNCAFKFKMKYPWSWQVHYWKTRISRPPGQWASCCVLSKSHSVVCEWRYPLDHRNTIISTRWHHSALRSSSSATPRHGPHTHTHTTARLLQHNHCVQRPAHCLRRGTLDNVANLCPNHDPTLLLWPRRFPT